jgi:hypothetical protein
MENFGDEIQKLLEEKGRKLKELSDQINIEKETEFQQKKILEELEFANKFKDIETGIVVPVIKTANEELGKKTDNITFTIHKDTDENKIRQYIQIMLDIKNEEDVLKKPSLILEGLKKERKIRIFESYEANIGNYINIEDVNEEIIKTHIYNLLSKYLKML